MTEERWTADDAQCEVIKDNVSKAEARATSKYHVDSGTLWTPTQAKQLENWLNGEQTMIQFECQNCGKLWNESELKDIRDYSMRVEDGEPVPSGECPECGALCHSQEKQ